MGLPLFHQAKERPPITLDEVAAYSVLWSQPGVGPRTAARLIHEHGSAVNAIQDLARLTNNGDLPGLVEQMKSKIKGLDFNWEAIDDRDPLYPPSPKKAETFPPYLFLRGDRTLLAKKNIAIVGTRKPTAEGEKRAKALGIELAKRGIVVTSGMAEGIDRAAHVGAFQGGGKTIAVVGTPLNQVYPRTNRDVHDRIVSEGGLIVSQFPFFTKVHQSNFPERNRTMAAISQATVIVEAGETSGVHYQADYCLKEEKPLFMMRSLLDRFDLAWPKRMLAKGGRELGSIDDLFAAL